MAAHRRCPAEELWLAFEARNWERAASLLHENLIVEWPLSRERFRGRDAFINVNRAYPGDWHIIVQHVVDSGDRIETQVRVDIGDERHYALSFFELRDGLIARITDWWPVGGYEPPTARLPYAERIEELP